VNFILLRRLGVASVFDTHILTDYCLDKDVESRDKYYACSSGTDDWAC
jgi:hypothetical protein